jgi:MtrB/PioB family decaheme-associated outer membrane protein
MKRLVLAGLLTALAASARAQTPAPPPVPAATPSPAATPTPAPVANANDFFSGEADLGLIQKNVDTISSKFLEYRDIPNGIVVPFFRLNGQKDGLRYDFAGQFVQQADQRYLLRVEKDWFRLDGDYNDIPHRFGNGGRTLEQRTGNGVYQISDTLQQSFQTAIGAPRSALTYGFLNALVAPSLAASPADVDLALNRERSRLGARFTPGPVDVNVSYYRERRTGDRADAGTSFGFGNVVETPEPVGYLTQDIGADAELKGTWGVARAGVHYNWFKNNIPSLSFDNPFRATDSTDASAYQSPGSASTAGPRFGTVALPPDNDTVTGTAGVTLKLGKRSRLGADLAIGRWNQDTTPFIPYSTNTAITAPFAVTDPANLPAQKLDGKVDTTAINAYFNSRPVDQVSFNLRFRRYDFDNKTARISIPGYVRFDAAWEAIPRISVPYGYTNDRLDATVDVDLGKLTIEGGYRRTAMDRTFRETEKTTENTGLVNVDLRPADWFVLRAGYEHGRRGYQGLDIGASEDASQVTPAAPGNVYSIPAGNPAFAAIYASFGCGGAPCNLRFDQAARKSDHVSAQLQASPGSGKATFGLSWNYNKDDYDETRYGLTLLEYNTLTAEVDYSPSGKWTVYGFYTWERTSDDLRGRQSGATVSASPLDDWTSNVEDKINSLGAGATLTFVPEKWSANLFARWQKVDGNNALASAAGGAPALARVALGGVQSIPAYDDTTITSVNAELRYQLRKAWSLSLGGWYEKYDVADAQTTGLVNYVPGSFFLAANDGPYRAWWGYLKLSYRW